MVVSLLRPLLCLVTLVLLGCSPVVNANFSDVEVTRSDIPVPAAPSSNPTNVPFSFTVGSGQLGANTDLNAQSRIRSMDLHRLTLTAKSGITDLSFVSRLHAVAFVPLSKTETSQTSRMVEIADYERVATTPVGRTLEIPLPEPVDLVPLLRPSKPEPAKIVVSVNLTGELPTVDWTTDVSMVLSMEVHQ